MKVKITELQSILSKFAERVIEREAAEYFAREVIETHLRKSPRSNPLKSAIGDIKASQQKVPIKYVVDLPSYVSVDFKGQGPLAYIKEIHDLLEARAEANGIAMVAFTNSKSMHTLHTWVQGLAKRGLFAIAFCNGGPRSVVPFNGTKGLFGTNPMAYGFPGKDDIYCVDMATSEIPYFEILDAKKNNTPLREKAAVDNEGNFTTNPDEALDYTVSQNDPTSNLTPLGSGYKGYYLVYLIELMTSGLIGMPSSPEMSTDFVAEEHGATLIVFSPKAFGTTDALDKTIEVLHNSIKSQSPRSGETIRVPGNDSNLKLKTLEKSGEIEVDDKLWQELHSLAKNVQ